MEVTTGVPGVEPISVGDGRGLIVSGLAGDDSAPNDGCGVPCGVPAKCGSGLTSHGVAPGGGDAGGACTGCCAVSASACTGGGGVAAGDVDAVVESAADDPGPRVRGTRKLR